MTPSRPLKSYCAGRFATCGIGQARVRLPRSPRGRRRGFAKRTMAAALGSALALAACVSTQLHEAPIVEHSQVGHPPAPVVTVPAAKPAPAAPALTREAHDGQYVVQAGDTLYSIAVAFGQDFRDIARWNELDDQAHLQPGRTLRVAPPPDDTGGTAQASPVALAPATRVETRPLAPSNVIEAPPASAPSPTAPTSAPTPTPTPAPADQTAAISNAPAAPATTDNKAATVEANSVWAWPSSGKLIDRFDDAHNKGIDISGKVGDPVYAANDGQVVYSGNGLPGYGKLVIIKHTDDYVSVYAHNNEILVTQGQAVKRGQRIADLGMTDASNPGLHFEIRRRGTPVDPLTYLPPR
jgi:lipoprotein NlpD